MSNIDIWFGSDHHFGHFNAIEQNNRPFKTTHEMNMGMIEIWNSKVKPGDLVYYLGDIAINHQRAMNSFPHLNGEFILIAGNHDKCYWNREKDIEFYLSMGIKRIHRELKINYFKNRQVLLSHLPYAGDQTEKDRYLEYRPKDDGNWLIHGHIHRHWHVRGRMINVSVDANGLAPLHIDEIRKIMKKGMSQNY